MNIGVSAVVFNKEKTKVLVQKREDLRIWTIPGGGVEPKESPAEAAVREVLEETGIEVEPVRLSGIYLQDIRFLEALNLTFVCRPVGGKLTTSSENIEVAWMFIKEALKNTVGSSPQKIKDALKERKNLVFRVRKDFTDLPRNLKFKWIFIQIKRRIRRLFNKLK